MIQASQFLCGMFTITTTIELFKYIPDEYQHYTCYCLLVATLGTALVEKYIDTDKFNPSAPAATAINIMVNDSDTRLLDESPNKNKREENVDAPVAPFSGILPVSDNLDL